MESFLLLPKYRDLAEPGGENLRQRGRTGFRRTGGFQRKSNAALEVGRVTLLKFVLKRIIVYEFQAKITREDVERDVIGLVRKEKGFALEMGIICPIILESDNRMCIPCQSGH